MLFSEAITAFHRAGNVPQLVITLASLPALFEHLDRPEPAATLLAAISRQPSSARHVPELSDLGSQLTRRLGSKRTDELRLPERCSISTVPPCTRSGRSTSPVGARFPARSDPVA